MPLKRERKYNLINKFESTFLYTKFYFLSESCIYNHLAFKRVGSMNILALKYISFYVNYQVNPYFLFVTNTLSSSRNWKIYTIILLVFFLSSTSLRKHTSFYYQNPDKIKLSVAATISISLVSSVPFNAKIHPRTSFTSRGGGVASFKTALPQCNIVFQNPYLA